MRLITTTAILAFICLALSYVLPAQARKTSKVETNCLAIQSQTLREKCLRVSKTNDCYNITNVTTRNACLGRPMSNSCFTISNPDERAMCRAQGKTNR